MANSEHFAEFHNPKSFFFLEASNLAHLVIRELGIVKLIAAQSLTKVFGMILKRSLSAGILGVVFMRPKKQVIGIYARRIISTRTIMTDKEVITESMNRTPEEIPGPTMGINLSICGHDSITGLGLAFVPQPTAIIGQIHAFHKCCDRVRKLVNEKLSLFSGDEHLRLCEFQNCGQLGHAW
jgi:hypothetical protein